MSFKLFPSFGMIDIHGIAHLNIFVLIGRRRLGVLGLGYWGITALCGSRRPSVLIVGHCRIVGGFGNWFPFFALEEGLFVFIFDL
jgi:hypothetical protein